MSNAKAASTMHRKLTSSPAGSPELLYHYTSAATGALILQEDEIWLNPYASTSDPREAKSWVYDGLARLEEAYPNAMEEFERVLRRSVRLACFTVDRELNSFSRNSAYGAETLKSNSTGECGSTCLQSNKLTTFNAPKYGMIELDAQVQGAGGGSINALALYTSSGSGYLVSPASSDVLTTVGGVFQGQSEQQSSAQTLAQFTASPSVQTAELIYESLAF